MKTMLLNSLRIQMISLFAVLMFYPALLQAQDVRCGTMYMDSIRRANNPDLQTDEEFESWLAKLIQERKKLEETAIIINGVYQIPIVVHVVHNGEAIGTGTNISVAAIQSQIDVLNEDFRRIFGSNGWNTHPDGADVQIEFCLARRRPDGTAFPAGEDGINRINRNTVGWTAPPFTTAYIDGTIKPYTTTTQFGGWDPADYMNFWSCNISGGILGYAQFPTTILSGMDCNADPVSTDGVVMLYSSIGKSAVTGFPGPYNEGRTATHEIGHWMGLRHIWGDAACGNDFCSDTPQSNTSNFGCPTLTTCDGIQDMVENYMDYTDDLCMNIFTNDQKMRMRIVMENSPIRASLITSDACIPPTINDASIVNVTNPIGDNCPGSIVPTVSLKNRGSANLTTATIAYTIDNGTPVTFSWSGSIAPGAQANVNLPAFTATYGIHTFKSYSLLPNGVIDPDPTYDTTELQFAVSTGYQPNYTQNFDGGVFAPDLKWTVVNPNSDCYEWIGQGCTSSTGVNNNVAAMMTNYLNTTNQDEYLYTPIFILPCNATSAQVSFDKAYRRRINGSTDRLRLEMSLNCGATWTTVLYDQNGTGLQSVATAFNGNFIPTSAAQWNNVVIDLTPFVGATSQTVKFRFRATNVGNGGNIFVDNFQFSAVTPGEIQVSASGTDVLDEGYFNFGSHPVGATTTVVFTVTNTGTSNLTLTPPINVTGAPQFVLNATFGSTTVAPGASTTFSIDFIPDGAGPFSGNVSFGTNDCDEGTYNFVLTGTGNVTPPVANFTLNPSTICEGESVTFTDASIGAATWSWTFPGGTPSSAVGAGPHVVQYTTAGTYNASLTVTNPFGTDTETQLNSVTVLSSTGQALPITEGFVLVTFPPTNWSLNNNGNAITWVRSGTQGNAPTAGNSARIDNYNTNTTGDEDDLVMPPADMSALTSAQLEFDVAYARYDATYNDQLDVLVSTDCGSTWTVVYSKASTVLATDPDQTAAYTAPATWRTETVDLTPFVGNQKVEVLFRNISGWGQFLYIDNVNLTGVSAAENADFTISGSMCINQTITFTDASLGATSWDWNFGVGATPATATGIGPHAVTYASSGPKTITLSINGGSDIATQSITINPMDDATFAYGASSYCTSAANPTPVISGLPGGAFSSSPAGLSLNSTTGLITLNTSTPGIYTVTYTTNGTCPNTQNQVVEILATPSAPVVTVVDGCGSSTLSATGSNLLWSTGATTSSINVASAGTYTVTQTVGGCTSSPATASANPIAIPSAPVVTVVDGCGSSTLTATGSNLLWSTGATTSSINVASAGTYTVTQTVGGCTSSPATASANPIAIPSAPVVTVVDGCGSSTLSATGSNLLWSTGATTSSINVASAGTYTVTQTVGGCTSSPATASANPIAIPSAPVVTVVDGCGSSTLSATGSNLLWSTGATTSSINVASAGTYTVTQTVGGCTSSPAIASANPIAIPSAPVVTVVDGCGSSTLSATGSNLLWSTGATTSSINVASAGTYTVTQTVGGCTSSPATASANPIAIPSAPVVTVVDGCGSSTLSATGSNLVWSTGETNSTIIVVNPGTYTVTQSVGGCASLPASVPANPVAVPSAPVVTVVDGCGSSTLTATGSNLMWSTGENTNSIIATVPGIYYVVQSVGPCSSPSSSAVANPFDMPAIPVITASGPLTFCQNENVVLTSSELTGNEWSNLATSQSITVSTSGTFAVMYTDGNGCSSTSAAVVVTVQPLPNVSILPFTPICLTDVSFTLSGGSPAGGNYTGTGVLAGVFDPAQAGIGTHAITYTYTDGNGCTNFASEDLVVQDCAKLDELALSLGIAIYPNPTHDFITIESKGSVIGKISISDAAGRILLEELTPAKIQTFDLQVLAPGVYNVMVTTDKGIRLERIVKY